VAGMNLQVLRWIFALAIVPVGVAVVAQSPPTELPAKSQPPTVSVPFFADDGHGHPVGAITQADVSILDNKKPPQSIVAIRTARDLPLRLGALIDTSNSERVSALYQPGVKAISDFIKQVLKGPEDRVFIESFANVPNASGFMNTDELLKFQINLRPGGGTTLFDAVYLACNKRMQDDRIQPARRVLVILSDGGDNLSDVSLDKAVAAAQEAGTVVFAVSTSKNAKDSPDSRVLERFANDTGGLAFAQLSPGAIPSVFSMIREQIENMYAVTYVPSDLGQLGRYRSIELKVTSNEKLKIHAPKGYYVTAGVR
jgi:Ca-activated chloride channel homolog